MAAIISAIKSDSIAEEAGICVGDTLISVNGNKLRDILDYRFYTADDELLLELQNAQDVIYELEIYNGDYEDLGLSFADNVFDGMKQCANKCVFCFIDQLPPNMRPAVYVKDDDYRLSALTGSYVTLTNVTERDINRIIAMRLPRINISVHATDPKLRAFMLGCKNEAKADIMPQIQRFAEAGMQLNCQIVLCRGINDGEHLKRTISDLSKYAEAIGSVAVVPAGMTKYRQGLHCLEEFDIIYCVELIETINKLQNELCSAIGNPFVYIADEFYCMAGLPIPPIEHYGELLQIENGVGLIASLTSEFEEALSRNTRRNSGGRKSIATGVSAYQTISGLVKLADCSSVAVYAVPNTFFGETVTVAGLVTGGDIIRALRGKDLGEELLIPRVMLNHDMLFLDNLTVADVERELNLKVVVVDVNGADLLNALLD